MLTDDQFAEAATLVLGPGWRPTDKLLQAESHCERYTLEHGDVFAGKPWLVGIRTAPGVDEWAGVRPYATPEQAAASMERVREVDNA